ncbi:hypothetical protein BD408DRAFT_421244 [Parasitella parasitica]|nr:hypothetical protein BD408DRAFT_421244 [Parasitella parasitica]
MRGDSQASRQDSLTLSFPSGRAIAIDTTSKSDTGLQWCDKADDANPTQRGNTYASFPVVSQ